MGLLSSGTSRIAPGALPLSYVTGRYYKPQWAVWGPTTLTTGVGRLYYAPIYIWTARTFAGAAMFNSGAGDTGEVLRLGLYTDNSGLPGTRVTDFGEITLGGSAILNTLTASAACAPGWHWLAYHANTGAAVYAMAESINVSSAGFIGSTENMLSNEMGLIDITAGAAYGGLYVDTAYGAFASSAVAPTNSSATVPVMWLKA